MLENKVILQTTNASVLLQAQGAQILSWVSGGSEQLFLSHIPVNDARKPRRGGVPIIFPQFGAFGRLPKHGFARDLPWRIVEKVSASEVVLELTDSEISRDVFPYSFRAQFKVLLTDTSLAMQLSIENCSSEVFDFTAALHTYFLVDDIFSANIEGLNGASFWNNGEPAELRHQSQVSELQPGQVVQDKGSIDRIYYNTRRSLVLSDAGSRTISSDGFADTVVWNPGPEGSVALADMGDEDYRRMLCVESAMIGEPVSLLPGASWQGSQTVTC